MTDPLSLKQKSFTTIYDFKDGVVADDYSGDCFETWKFKAKTSNASSVDFKAKFPHTFTAEKEFQVSYEDELKLKFSFLDNKYWAWFGKRTKKSGTELKFHFDLGNRSIQGKDLNFFTNLKTMADFKRFSFRVGANHFGQNIECNSRIEVNNEKQFAFTLRNLFRKDKFFLGHVSVFGLKSFCLQNFALGFEEEKWQVYLQRKCCKDKCTAKCCSECKYPKFNKGYLNGLFSYTWKEYTFGTKLGYSLADKSRVFETAVQSKVNDKLTLKGKVATAGEALNFNSTTVDLAVVAKYKVNSLLSLTATTTVPLRKVGTEGKCCGGCCCFPPLGLQFDVNL